MYNWVTKKICLFICLIFSFGKSVHAQNDFLKFSDSTFRHGALYSCHSIRFALEKAEILSDSYGVLDSFVLLFSKHTNFNIEVGYHQDSRASIACCTDLSSARAKSVRSYLIDKGISPKRLVAKGYGESQPNTVYRHENTFSIDKPQNDLPFDKIVLTEAFINQFRDKDKETFEQLHRFNRRVDFKVIAKLEDEHDDYFTLSDSIFYVGQFFYGDLEFRFPLCQPNFPIEDYFLGATQSAVLDSLIVFINRHPNLTFQIETHTDSRGSRESNQVLSERRAIQIGNYFIEKGASNRQLRWKGIGEDEPITVYLQNGKYFKLKPKNDLQFEKVQLTETYINQFKVSDNIQFETLHQLNRRTTIRIVDILN